MSDLISEDSVDSVLKQMLDSETEAPTTVSGKDIHRMVQTVLRENGRSEEYDHDQVQRAIFGAVISGQIEADPQTIADLKAAHGEAVSDTYRLFSSGQISFEQFNELKRRLGVGGK